MQEKSEGSTRSTTVNAWSEENLNSLHDFSDLLPLELIKSEIIPPSPTRSVSTIDWLPEFSGYSWIGYGASSLLVISHFPSPLSQEETIFGPVFRQVIELSGDESAVIKAVAWSPSTPSEGDLAVAFENRVCLYSDVSGATHGSFCWSQSAALAQSSMVEAIGWTGSGDGIIAAGIEVAIWRKKGSSWEISWKFRTEQPQILVSATWSTEGPVATAAYSSQLHVEGSSSLIIKASKCVLVCDVNEKYGFLKTELCHPQPVLMIQWRPVTGKHSRKDSSKLHRNVLLTCCLDGTVRLWSEIDGGKGRKYGKDISGQKTMRQSFHVIAVIEINQSLNGTLGTDTFVTWVTETVRFTNAVEEVNSYLPTDSSELDTVGVCDWMVGFGPGSLLTLWAIHCLDEICPLRFPRVTLWKSRELLSHKVGHLQRIDCADSMAQSIFVKAIISRNQVFGPPIVCSLIQLLPCNSISWSQLYTMKSNDAVNESMRQPWKESCLSCSADGLLKLDCHSGNIVQVAIHPYSRGVELAVSLDSRGVLHFWSLPMISNCILGVPTLAVPKWKILGKTMTQNLSDLRYSTMRWAPSILNKNRILLLGHAEGIDCIMVQISENDEKVLCHKLCTIPFPGHNHEGEPTNTFVMPLPSTFQGTSICNSFMLVVIWTKEFQALSWKVTLHLDDLSGSSCRCCFDVENTGVCDKWRHESSFAGTRYCVIADPCSSRLADPHDHGQVTSVAITNVTNLLVSSDDLDRNSSAYHMATGYSDGSLKLWRISPAKSSLPHFEMLHIPWELVGTFTAHQGPVIAISLSDCGRKIATVSRANHCDTVITLHIWESVHLIGNGKFLLEDKINLEGIFIALNWLALGNGLLLLGVCMQNELRVYTQRRGGQSLVKTGKSSEMHVWFCIAHGRTPTAARDFLWGPRATPVLVHSKYFSIFSQLSFYMDRKHQSKCYPKFMKDRPLDCLGGTDRSMLSTVITDCSACKVQELSTNAKSEGCESILPAKMNMKNDFQFCNLSLTRAQQQCESGTMTRTCSIQEAAGNICGSLPVYCSEALLMNLYSGHWKRAYVALRHLVQHVASDNAYKKGFTSAKSSCIIPQILLSEYLEECLDTNSVDKGLQWGGDASFGYNLETNSSNSILTSTSGKSEISGFLEAIEKFHDLGGMTNMEKIRIHAIIDVLGELNDPHSSSAYRSLDAPGQRFWVAVRFQQLYYLQKFGRQASIKDLVVDSGLIGWAFHSDCQENLFSSVLSKEPSWLEMRNLGVGFWFTDTTQLRTRMEKLARLQYLRKKDPKDCALLYIALNRIQVLVGLFKISKDEKDRPLVGFLSRNFQEEKNKAAALKNAYVLMGRHQMELAVAFFLLGGDPYSAVTICAKSLQDEQLALVICRLVEGCSGPLECHLISKFLLPTAIEKGDFWLASLFEWVLGNYSESLMHLVGFQIDSKNNESVLAANNAVFIDPTIGQYCQMIATKNNMQNALGECTAVLLNRWATLMTATALNRCGFNIEALECLSSSLSTVKGKDQESISDMGNGGVLHGLLNSSQSEFINWLSGDVASHLESQTKVDLAVEYISKLIMEHPSWLCTNLTSYGALSCVKEYRTNNYELSLQNFHHKLNTALATFEQKYSLYSVELINMILIYLSNNGLLFLGHDVLHSYTFPEHSHGRNCPVESFHLCPILPNLLLNSAEEITCFFARYIVACSSTFSLLKSNSNESVVVGNNRSWEFDQSDFHVHGFMQLMESLRVTLKVFSCFLAEDISPKAFYSLDLLEYCVLFASAWLQRNLKCLILMIKPVLIAYKDGNSPSKIDMENLKKIISQNAELMPHDSLSDDIVEGLRVAKQPENIDDGGLMSFIPEDDKGQLIWACVWLHVSNFMKIQLKLVFDDLEDGYSCNILPGKLLSWKSDVENSASDWNNQIKLLPINLAKLLENTFLYISSYHIKQISSFLREKVENGSSNPTLLWLEQYGQYQSRTLNNHLDQEIDSLQMSNNKVGVSHFHTLWEISADPMLIREAFAKKKLSWSNFCRKKLPKGWIDMHREMIGGCEMAGTCDQEIRINSSALNGTGSPDRAQSPGGSGLLDSSMKDSCFGRDITCFQNPVEIYKKNGELFEAVCLNSIDQQQAALASNRKGIYFFKWKDELPFRDQSDFIWSEADWPKDGWAGSESTPIPTSVSPGIGLGSKKGTHLGLGGATIGLGSLARPGRDLTGGGAFGIPGYAGIGASGLGWGIQEDFEEFVDPPATVDNIRTRALCSHPLRPFFLVGSSNTHVYLWEFGKEQATATYGVLPAANVPPPYALASISALQFDHCGHRFATAALDGTVCTWQLEVGGRSNVHPTESCLCFSSHASDVSYMAASGSVIGAAGYSSNGINVVIWDTLAPPTNSQASLTCHEGGARSLSVFDNDIGSSSISPLIVTGGKDGDIGLHDFRFIATGRAKKHRHSVTSEQNFNSFPMTNTRSGAPNKFGEQNLNGMLWYIPKAHQDSVTRISTIPNTSLFLTGSKDGDVKLWDAKRAKLVFHWPKLHERHTFLQPSSRGFGGVVRAAVTDIKVLPHGFLSCGGDGTVKMIQLKDFQPMT